jgi:hypothetical protein
MIGVYSIRMESKECKQTCSRIDLLRIVQPSEKVWYSRRAAELMADMMEDETMEEVVEADEARAVMPLKDPCNMRAQIEDKDDMEDAHDAAPVPDFPALSAAQLSGTRRQRARTAPPTLPACTGKAREYQRVIIPPNRCVVCVCARVCVSVAQAPRRVGQRAAADSCRRAASRLFSSTGWRYTSLLSRT